MAAAIRVLYVDDEPEMLEIGKLFLEDSGDFTVTTSLSAPDAIRLLELEKFDAIITDYQMPGMDGIQFLIEVRARFGPIPFILFTGRGREKVVIEAINNGVDFYLQKGGDPEPQFAELSHKIKQAASRRKVDDALKKSEENFRAIADYTVNWESWFGPDGKYIWVSPSVAGFTGYSAGEILAMPDFISTVIAKEDRSLFTERFREAIRGTRGENFEFRYLHRNGTKHWLNVSWQPIVDRDGNSFGTRSSGHDITEHKQQEEALQESQKRYQALTETTSDFVWEMDSNGVYTYCSPQIHDLWGYKPEDIIGRSPFDLMMPEDREQGIRMFRTISESSGPFKGLETRSRDNTGRIVTLETSGVPFFDINGRLCGYRGISRDITERKQVEESLRKSERFVSSIIESTPNLIYIYDLDEHRNVYTNKEIVNFLGYSSEQILALGSALFENILHLDDAQTVAHHHARMKAAKDDDIFECEYRMKHAKGTWRILRSRDVVFSRDSQGLVQQILGSTEDITKQKEADETIKSNLAEKEILLREIHHRVKNNLGGIISLIELQTSSLTDPDQIYLLKDLETRIRSMVLVHESLYQTKDIAHIRLASYTENLTRYLFQVYESVTNVRCRIDIGEITMPFETATPCGLVMTEIVTNSLKYAFPKTFSCREIRGEPCTISIAMHREGNDYILTIADNGIGIPDGTDVTMKTSLGLYLIRFIVKHQLHGSTEVSTGNGTSYTIRFPEPKRKERPIDE